MAREHPIDIGSLRPDRSKPPREHPVRVPKKPFRTTPHRPPIQARIGAIVRANNQAE